MEVACLPVYEQDPHQIAFTCHRYVLKIFKDLYIKDTCIHYLSATLICNLFSVVTGFIDERIIIRRKCVRDYKRYATNTSAWVLNITSHLNEL